MIFKIGNYFLGRFDKAQCSQTMSKVIIILINVMKLRITLFKLVSWYVKHKISEKWIPSVLPLLKNSIQANRQSISRAWLSCTENQAILGPVLHWKSVKFLSTQLRSTTMTFNNTCTRLAILAWCLWRYGCSSWWWAQTRCTTPILACGRAQWMGEAEPLDCPSLSGSGQSSPSVPPE